MSNQLHGKIFEDIIKSAFSGSSDRSRETTSKWDIESIYDKDRLLATSVKSCKSKTKLEKNIRDNITIFLSDARRFWDINEPFRLLVGLYNQQKGVKVFFEIREYIITREIHKILIGDISKEEVIDFHNKIKTKKGKEGSIEAREFAKNYKDKFKKKSNLVYLNPKIDSKSQRRLQCSIQSNKLESIKNLEFKIYNDEFKDLVLPIQIKSEKRILKKV